MNNNVMAKKVTAEEAKSFFIRKGIEPIDRFPGPAKPWKSRCLKCKHIISPSLGNVRKTKKVCVYCSGKKVHPDDALKVFKSAKLKPVTEFPGANKPWPSIHLVCGGSVSPRYSDVKGGQGGCKKCGYKSNQAKQLQNSATAIQTLRDKGFEPLVDYPGSNRPWKSRCLRCNNVVSPYLCRLQAGTGCGVCSGKIVVPEIAERIMRSSHLEPLEPYPGGKKPWKCKCKRCGNLVSPKYSDINQGDGGCKYCGGTFVEPDFAYQVMVSVGAIPQEDYSHNAKKWHCICSKCGKDIYPTWNRIQQGYGACVYCAKRRVDRNDAEVLMISKGASPIEPYPGAQKAWRCQCLKCKRVIFPRYSEVANRNYTVCGYCAGKKVDPQSAIEFMISRGLTPLVPYERADKPWLCKCQTCGKNVYPRYSAIRIGQGCKYCSNNGLDYGAPAFLYLITHNIFGAHKLGIGNHKTQNNRIREHRKNGWDLYKTLDFSSGEQAFEVEQSVLHWIRNERKLDVFLSESQMPQRGFTETVDASEIRLVTLWNKVLEFSKVKM
jgi:hypothetical protein